MTGIYSVDFYDENTGIIFGGDWNAKEMNSKNKAITEDGGKTWTLLADGQDPGYRSCVKFIPNTDAKNLLAVGIPGISYSNNRGKTWYSISGESYYTVGIFDKSFWVAGDKKIAKIVWENPKQ